MRTRRILAVAVTAALVTPSLVLADGIGPHTNWYDQHPNSRKPQNDVTILFHRDKHDADLFVSNFCLGTEPGGPAGSPPFPNSASARGVGVKHGKISFDGKATIFTQNGQRKVALKFSAVLKAKKATGTAKFPTEQQCKTIHFKAKLAKRTK